MSARVQCPRPAFGVLSLLVILAVSGCIPRRVVTAGPPPPEIPPASVPLTAEAPPAPNVPEPASAAPAPAPDAPPTLADPSEAAEAPIRVHESTPEIPETPPRQEVAILYNRDEPQYAQVAVEVADMLDHERYWLTLADVENEDSLRVARALRGRPGLHVVAVGLPAARFARDELNAPIVFAQVFDPRELSGRGRVVRGVEAMPPLDLQLHDWKKLDPGLGRVGLIVSERHADLIPEAERAARTVGLAFEQVISGSDQETLYQFRRLAPRIDGLWLIPDDRILSPGVLGELLDYAASHQVEVCVFTDSLLDWGALLSASGTSTEIAHTAHQILERMIAGEGEAVPLLTPLSEVAVRINPEVARRLGVTPPETESWIVRRR